MPDENRKIEHLDFAGAFEQGWIQYKSNFVKLIFFGLLAATPMSLFFLDISTGVVATLFFQGFFFIVLADFVSSYSSGVKNNIFNLGVIVKHFKNGFILTLFLLPLMILGFVFLVIPAVFIFSLFMFSFFFVALKEKFAIDACMESLREGSGYRLHLFLFALIFFSSMVVIFMISEVFPPMFIIICGLFFPYIFSVMYEFYEQLERK